MNFILNLVKTANQTKINVFGLGQLYKKQQWMDDGQVLHWMNRGKGQKKHTKL